MKIAVAADHAGVSHKNGIAQMLRQLGHEVEDMGTHGDESVDYPDYAGALAKAVAGGAVERGVLVCATGIGMSIAANRVKGVRAALCHDEHAAEICRRHNNANVLCSLKCRLTQCRGSNRGYQWRWPDYLRSSGLWSC